MTWNLWWRFGPWEQRRAAIEAVIDEQAPDVLCLQEVWSEGESSLAEEVAVGRGWHVAVTDDPFPQRDVGFHNAIVSRWPMTDVESIALVAGDGTPGHRRVLVADVHTPWGAWPVGSTHLAYRFDESALRQHQAEQLLHVVAGRRGDPETALPMVLCGDFNAVPDSDEVRLLTGRRAGPIPNLVLSDAWEQVGDGAGCTWRSDNPYQGDTAWPNRRLDYVFVSWPRPKPVGNPVRAWLAGAEPVDGPAGPMVPSDHAAVVVELRVPG